MSAQLSSLLFSGGTDLAFRGHVQTPHPTPQPCGFILFPGDTYRAMGWGKATTSAFLLMHSLFSLGSTRNSWYNGTKGGESKFLRYGVWYVFERARREMGGACVHFFPCLFSHWWAFWMWGFALIWIVICEYVWSWNLNLHLSAFIFNLEIFLWLLMIATYVYSMC